MQRSDVTDEAVEMALQAWHGAQDWKQVAEFPTSDESSMHDALLAALGHLTAAKDAEIEQLTAQVAELKSEINDQSDEEYRLAEEGLKREKALEEIARVRAELEIWQAAYLKSNPPKILPASPEPQS